MEEQILELTRQVTILNERLPNHISWTERNVLDHEKRLRLVEQKLWIIAGASGVIGAAIATMINTMLGA
jgi:uncharacterized membrane protein YsdA (DUF1294 family)